MAALAGLPGTHRAPLRYGGASTGNLASPGRRATCGCFWWKTISPAGSCCRPSFPAMANVTSPSTAGKPWSAFRAALERGQPYDLICMDIMMPEMDGREAVRQVRAIEAAHGILSTSGAKIIMTTTVDDIKEVIRCFQRALRRLPHEAHRSGQIALPDEVVSPGPVTRGGAGASLAGAFACQPKKCAILTTAEVDPHPSFLYRQWLADSLLKND